MTSRTRRRSPSASLLNQSRWIERLPVKAYLEVKVRCAGAAAVTGEPDDLACAHRPPSLNRRPVQVSVHGLVPLGMLQEDESPVLRVGPSAQHGTPARCTHHGPDRYCNVKAGMLLVHGAGAYLTSR